MDAFIAFVIIGIPTFGLYVMLMSLFYIELWGRLKLSIKERKEELDK